MPTPRLSLRSRIQALAALALLAALAASSLRLERRTGPAAPDPGLPPWPPELAGRFDPRAPESWSRPVAAPPPLDTALAARGRESFARHCVACHGEKGRGDGPLAAFLSVPPRDLTRGVFKLQGSARDEDPLPADVYRSIVRGLPATGMPAFAHLAEDQRWALVAEVLRLADLLEPAAPPRPLKLPPAPPIDSRSLKRGRLAYARAGCIACHGTDLAGDGPSARTLRDAQERAIPMLDLRRGPDGFARGWSAEDIAATLLVGLPGTPMPAVPELERDARQLWDLARYTAWLARQGEAARRRSWADFFRRWRADHPQGGPWPRIRTPGEQGPPPGPGGSGCLSCHQGVEWINEVMRPALLAFAGGREGHSCVVCHEGQADAAEQQAAHRGLVRNPGDLWAVGLGLGCGKCHVASGGLTSIHARALPEPVGGGLMSVRSRATDPTGATGADQAYRVQRSLMALETGKVAHSALSAGLDPDQARGYADFDVDDPDGPEPRAGSEDYRRFMAQARKAGALPRLERLHELPPYARALAAGGVPRSAGLLEFARKTCNQCHLWGAGQPQYRQHRGSGCSACHTPYGLEGRYEGGDPTIPRNEVSHVRLHQVTLDIRDDQCFRCHNREFQRHNDEVHLNALSCVDCHTSIDMHGDGNLYGRMSQQLEVRCEDCHGTRERPPWELPLGLGTPTPLSGERGTEDRDGQRYLFSSRGNAQGNWLREGEEVVIVRRADGRRTRAPLLRDAPARPLEAEPHDPRHAALSCAACHSAQVVRCGDCHARLDMRQEDFDPIASAQALDPANLGRRLVRSPGRSASGSSVLMGGPPTAGQAAPTGWPAPEIVVGPDGRHEPRVHPCRVDLAITDAGDRTYHLKRPPPTGLAPSVSHEFNRRARSCIECHPR